MASPPTARPRPGRARLGGHAPTHVRHAPVTPGKVAMWLFLATEVMFFTGLIGSYIVLRAGSTHNAYSNLYPPATPLKGLGEHPRRRGSSRPAATTSRSSTSSRPRPV